MIYFDIGPPGEDGVALIRRSFPVDKDHRRYTCPSDCTRVQGTPLADGEVPCLPRRFDLVTMSEVRDEAATAAVVATDRADPYRRDRTSADSVGALVACEDVADLRSWLLTHLVSRSRRDELGV